MLRQIVPIETVRLLLRAVTSDDEEAVFLFHSNPDVANYTGGLRSREHSIATLSRWTDRFSSKKWEPLAVVERGESQPIGWCGVQPMTHTNDFELFYGYIPRVRGKGYATEAASALMEAGFEAMKHSSHCCSRASGEPYQPQSPGESRNGET